MVSFTVHNDSGPCGESTVNLSYFFLRRRLPALRCLCLSEVSNIIAGLLGIADHRADHPLAKKNEKTSSTPTTSQLLSILSSNPNLQHLELPRGMVPDCDESTPRADKTDEVRFFLDECSNIQGRTYRKPLSST